MHFLKLRKNYVSLRNHDFLSVYYLVDLTVHIHTKTSMKFVFSKKNTFFDISSQNCAKASQIFQNIAKLKSIPMQMISDFMHFDTIALRQKKMQFGKWTVIVVVQCTGRLKPVLRDPNLFLGFYHGSKHTFVRSA